MYTSSDICTYTYVYSDIDIYSPEPHTPKQGLTITSDLMTKAPDVFYKLMLREGGAYIYIYIYTYIL